MRDAWSPRCPTEKDTVCLDLSRNQRLGEQKAAKGDQDVEGQGRLWSQADLAPLPDWVALNRSLNSLSLHSLICKSGTVRPNYGDW